MNALKYNNLTKDSKILIAYHANCIDGWTSAYVAYTSLVDKYKAAPDNITLEAVSYGKLEPLSQMVGDYDYLYVVDFSLPLHLLSYLEFNHPSLKVIIIDHHKTALAMYAEYEGAYEAEVVMAMNESGATLTYKYFHPESLTVPLLLNYVKDYDLWRFSLEHTKAVNMYLRVQPKRIAYWRGIENQFSAGFANTAIQEGEAILDYHEQIVGELTANAEEIELAGQKGLAVNCSGQFASDVGNKLAEEAGTFGCTYNQEKGDVKVSLRSIGDYDVSELAAKFGGGGHRNAAGFTILKDDIEAGGISLWNITER